MNKETISIEELRTIDLANRIGAVVDDHDRTDILSALTYIFASVIFDAMDEKRDEVTIEKTFDAFKASVNLFINDFVEQKENRA